MGWWPFGSKPAEGTGSKPAAEEKPKLKICCACPDTKRLRDECVTVRGEEHPYCQSLIEVHKQCLRLEGFKV